MKQIQIKTVDNEELVGLSWEIENAKANVVVFEGMEEHAKRYNKFASYFNERGFSVYCLDCFGQGLNVKKDLSNIGVWPEDGFAKQVMAYGKLVEELKQTGKPVFIFAHSMGAFMGQDFIQRFPGLVDKIVLCGSGAKNGGVPLVLFFAKIFIHKNSATEKSKILSKLMFGNFNGKIKDPKTPYDWLSYDDEVVDAYINDPLSGFGSNKGFCLEFLKGMNALYKKRNLKKINKQQKIFLISGAEDPVTGYAKLTSNLEHMYKKLGINDVSKKVYPNLRHEIHNEFTKNEVFDDVINFFNN